MKWYTPVKTVLKDHCRLLKKENPNGKVASLSVLVIQQNIEKKMNFELNDEQRMIYEYGDQVAKKYDQQYWLKKST